MTTTQRIPTVTASTTPAAAAPVLAAVQQQFGRVPHMFATFAQSPAALEAVTGFFGAMAKATLSPREQEAIAIAVAEENHCGYCLAAHTAIGKLHHVPADALAQFRAGRSLEPREQAILDLALAIVRTRGADVERELVAARAAGLGDGELVEVIAAVAQNVLTNYLNVVARTVVDFPRVG